ncbi:MAG: hypothetical protein U5L76_02465 [Patescibacteria group bacterium]|nr:hypothetical protein [Patescibacteria group bacterium]
MEHFTGNASEWSIYIGLTGLFFLLFSFFIRKKYKNLKFWLFVFLFFFIISLGPFLHVLGTIKPKIPLPYLFIYHYIPFFKNIRSVGRAFIYASLSISIISAFGFSYIFQKLKNKQTLLKICFLIFFSIIIIDFWAVPNTTSVEIPEIYHQMAKDKSDYKILLPTIDISHGVGSMSKYYKTLHGKDYVAGFHFARENPELFKKANRTPVVNNLIYALPYGRPTNSFIEQDIPLISNKTLNENNIKYIILNKQFIGKDITLDNWVKIRNFIEDNIKVKKVINDNHGLAYKVLPSKNNDIVILQKNNGWTDTRLLNTGEFVADASENNPSLLINNYSANNKNIALTLNIRSSQPNRKISLKLNNNEIKNFDLSQKRSIIKTLIENIKPGENRLDFILKDSLGQKIEISEHDTFTLSLNYKESKNFSYPQYYDDLARIISDNNVIQTPLIIYDSKNNNISKNNILRLNTLEQDEACSCLKIDDYSNFDSLKETIATKDINYQRINSQLCLKKYNIKYIIINKEFLSANEYSNMISYIAYSIPYKELIHNDNKLQIYQILEPDSKNKTWISNFEKNNINEWDNFYGSFNDITITKDSHTGKHSAQINFQPGQNFNGLIKLFNTPKIEASVEGWIKVKNWSEGFVSIYFDFIKNKDHFYKPKLIVNDSFYLPYHYTGHLYHNNEKINFPHNLPNEKWIKMKLEIKNSHLYVYQDEKEILKINNYVHSPLYGFRLGVGGCCPESNIQMLIDDFKITY